MNKYDRYLKDINPEILQDMARKRQRRSLVYDILGGVLLFGMLGVFSYLILSL